MWTGFTYFAMRVTFQAYSMVNLKVCLNHIRAFFFTIPNSETNSQERISTFQSTLESFESNLKAVNVSFIAIFCGCFQQWIELLASNFKIRKGHEKASVNFLFCINHPTTFHSIILNPQHWIMFQKTTNLQQLSDIAIIDIYVFMRSLFLWLSFIECIRGEKLACVGISVQFSDDLLV